jgi:hypothetical protein
MIIARLQGGLGNQMFQYAAARAQNKTGELVYLDCTALDEDRQDTATFTARHYELGIFNGLKAKNVNRLIYWVAKKLGMVVMLKEEDVNAALFQKVKSSRQVIYMDGYFQSAIYFRCIAQRIADEFTFPQPGVYGRQMAAQIKGTKNSVAIHVRRGDYLKPVKTAFHGLLPLTYYRRAVEKMESMEDDLHYFIFSEDAEWCRNQFTFLKKTPTIVVADQQNHWEDMYLMHLCRHQIIANSSYSWWAAWLNHDPDKVVIAPQNWFAGEIENQDHTIIPVEWIRV